MKFFEKKLTPLESNLRTTASDLHWLNRVFDPSRAKGNVGELTLENLKETAERVLGPNNEMDRILARMKDKEFVEKYWAGNHKSKIPTAPASHKLTTCNSVEPAKTLHSSMFQVIPADGIPFDTIFVVSASDTRVIHPGNVAIIKDSSGD